MTTIETASVRTPDPVEVDALDHLSVDGPIAEPPAEATAAEADIPHEARRSSAVEVVVRHVDPKSVLRVSLVFYGCLCAVLLTAGIVLWIGAAVTGVVGNLEGFIRDAGFNDFKFSVVPLFEAFALIGLVIVAAGTAANLLLAMLYNLLSETVGGIRVTLAEDVDPERGR